MGSIQGVHELVPHPDFLRTPVRRATVELQGFDGELLTVAFSLQHDHDLLLPFEEDAVRTDGLWRTTCFEIFVGSDGYDSYAEFNFSPSFAWAAYAFDRYREGMRPLPLPLEPDMGTVKMDGEYTFLIDLRLPPFPPAPTKLGLSAVIERSDGAKSYYALTHPPGPPDFHQSDSFTLPLPPTS